jgi:hypothetical protein
VLDLRAQLLQAGLQAVKRADRLAKVLTSVCKGLGTVVAGKAEVKGGRSSPWRIWEWLLESMASTSKEESSTGNDININGPITRDITCRHPTRLGKPLVRLAGGAGPHFILLEISASYGALGLWEQSIGGNDWVAEFG